MEAYAVYCPPALPSLVSPSDFFQLGHLRRGNKSLPLGPERFRVGQPGFVGRRAGLKQQDAGLDR